MRQLSILLMFSVILFSCDLLGGKRVSGNKKIGIQERQVSAFSNIEASGSVNVHIRQDSANGVKIETDENLMEYVEVYVTGSTLIIKSKSGYNLNPSKGLIVYTGAPVFKKIDVSGSGDIISDNIISGSEALEMGISGSGSINVQVALPKVQANVSGSGDVTLKGSCKEFSGSISGSGSIKAFDLITDLTTLHLSGAADAQVTANQKLDVSVSGSGHVKYKGSAAVSQSISGAGSVKKVG